MGSWGRRYLGVCNSHRFELLEDFVREDVQVNGSSVGLGAYVAGLASVVSAFPGYRWDLQRLVVSGDWVAAHFFDPGGHAGVFLGVPASGRRVETQEFAFYRVSSGLIAEVWVAVDNLRLLDQVR